jgi:magnesium-transporting ATPase (P-type)
VRRRLAPSPTHQSKKKALSRTRIAGARHRMCATIGKSSPFDVAFAEPISICRRSHVAALKEVRVPCQSARPTGLSLTEHRKRLTHDGPNRLSPPKQAPWWVKLLKHLFLGFSGLLWIAAVLCFVAYGFDPTTTDNLALAIVLIVVVVITALFAAYQEGRASAAMKGFAKLVPDAAVVLRGGEKVRVEAAELVVGDIIEVKGGDKIPGRLPHRVGRRLQSRQLVAHGRVGGAAAHGPQRARQSARGDEPRGSSRRLRLKAWRLALWSTRATAL